MVWSRFALSSLLVAALTLTACDSDSSSPPPTTGTSSTTSSSSTTAPANASKSATSTSPTSVPASKETAYLTAIDTASEGDTDKITFRFDGPAPGFSVAYSEGPVLEDGTGNPIELKGAAGMLATFSMATHQKVGNPVTPTYSGARRFSPSNASLVKEVAFAGDFEGRLSWAIGTEGKTPFTVTAASNPSSITISFKR